MWHAIRDADFDKRMADYLHDRYGWTDSVLRVIFNGKKDIFDLLLCYQVQDMGLMIVLLPSLCNHDPGFIIPLIRKCRHAACLAWFQECVGTADSLDVLVALLETFGPCISNAADVTYERVTELMEHRCAYTVSEAIKLNFFVRDIVDDAMLYAASAGDLKLIRWLCRYGAANHHSAVREAMWAGQCHVIRFLVRRYDMSTSTVARAIGDINPHRWRRQLRMLGCAC